MLKKCIVLLTASVLLFSSLAFVCTINGKAVQGWTIEESGGHCSQSSDGTIRLWSDGGAQCPYIDVVKPISPNASFSFSLQVCSNTAESFHILIRGSQSNKSCVTFEYGHYGSPQFLIVRNTNTWADIQFAYGAYHRWYTMQLTVNEAPFQITAEVFDQDGTLLGSRSVSDMTDLTFETISAIGFGVWGYSPSDYSVRNVTGLSFNPTQLSLSISSVSMKAGSIVNVTGRLTDTDGKAVSKRPVVLSYTFAGANEWIPITSDFTDEAGNFEMQWINSASGTFTLKTDWNGDLTYAAASNITTLSFAAYQSQVAFVVESNSTVSELAFNTTSSELHFTLSGPSGTLGSTKLTVAKSLIPNGADIKVFLDGAQLNYTLTETLESWILQFNYSHSTHNVTVSMASEQPAQTNSPTPTATADPTPNPTAKPTAPEPLLVLSIVIAVVIATMTLTLLFKTKLRKQQ